MWSAGCLPVVPQYKRLASHVLTPCDANRPTLVDGQGPLRIFHSSRREQSTPGYDVHSLDSIRILSPKILTLLRLGDLFVDLGVQLGDVLVQGGCLLVHILLRLGEVLTKVLEGLCVGAVVSMVRELCSNTIQ